MGWVFIVIPLLICCLKNSLYWLLNHMCLSTEAMCRLGIYIWGEGKKFYVLTKCVKKNTLLFSLGIFQ